MIASRLRELDQQMTAGKWGAGSDGVGGHAFLVGPPKTVSSECCSPHGSSMALFKDAVGITTLRNALPALANVVEAAGPMARLPWPVSSDERDDWRVYQQKLRDALAELAEALDPRP